MRHISLSRCLRITTLGLVVLWTGLTPGAAQSPFPVVDLGPGAPAQAAAASIRHQTTLDDRLLFTACDGTHSGLWSSQGLAATTTLLRAFAGEDCAAATGQLVAAEGRVYFTVGSKELWSSDGTVDGTRLAYRLPDDCTFGDLMVPVGSRLLLVVYAPGIHQVWISDGEPQQTGPLAPFAPFEVDGGYQMASLGDRAYLLVGNDQGEADLLVTDGTPEGSTALRHFDAFPPTAALRAVRLGSGDFIAPGTGPSALLASDGTVSGTVEALSMQLGFAHPQGLATVGDRLLFTAELGHGDKGLWSCDAGGTDLALVTTFAASEGESAERSDTMAVLGDRVVFVADDGVHGREPWISDGTPQGTKLLRDISLGPSSSAPGQLTAVGETLYFTAQDFLGNELWHSDGTADGTQRVADLATGPRDASPDRLTATQHLLYFTAEGSPANRQLWAKDLTPGLCTTAGGTLCLGNGRFRATVRWTDFEGRQGNGQAVPLSEDTGAFWFFGPQHLEAMIKIIDGRHDNDHFWIFYGALSNVAFELTVDDLVTGEQAVYVNPAGRFASHGDTHALPAAADDTVSTADAVSQHDVSMDDIAKSEVVESFELTLGEDGRFIARVQWTDFEGRQGAGTALPMTADSGAFWFFGERNLELMVKIVDGRLANGNYWIYYGALSNVAFRLTVEDTLTGNVKIYDNPAGRFGSDGDDAALPSAP